ncbi:TPA: phage tail terminator protein [Escherichia coli]
MSDPFSRLAARMDAITVRKMGKTASINDVDMTVIPLGFNYQRDNEMATWAMAEITYQITYTN